MAPTFTIPAMNLLDPIANSESASPRIAMLLQLASHADLGSRNSGVSQWSDQMGPVA
jgi:hypothetical protein